ncbi:MAG: SH3-like domain-containing protein [Pelagibacterales bacterium]|jgi:SH3-like domain-containing protein|nr:SH3-like domain-containing protein [Pelagibacterales bacterium]
MLKKIIILVFFFFLNSSLFADDEYFLTLRNDKVNLRQGPSFEYPIKIFYKKKYLPVLVQDKADNFRKIIDHENNTGWIHVSQLSKRNAAINLINDSLVFRSSTVYSKPLVVLKKGKLCMVVKCENNWCKIKVDKFTGWIKKSSLWGRI